LQEFIPYLEQIWKNKILTNNGPFHQQLEKELAEFLGVPYISLFAIGSLVLVNSIAGIAWFLNIRDIKTLPSFIKQK